ncbi:hypothetical protein N8584_02315 [bacterium]|nr:hypothetical protein [bacterium]
MDLLRLRTDLERTIDAFRARGIRLVVAYSYKTNYLRSVCTELDLLNCFAEVVSPFEVDMARRYGIEKSRIVYNGPVKDDESIRTVLSGGGVVNIDSLDDLALLRQVKGTCKGPPYRVGVRVSFPVEDLVSSRFGIDLNSTDYDTALKIIMNDQDLKLVSLNSHFPNRDIESFGIRARTMLNAAHKLPVDIQYLDIGGGFCSSFSHKIGSQLGFNAPAIEEYAAVIANEMKGAGSSFGGSLMIEPGTLLAANCLNLVGGVKSIKINQSVSYYTMDVSRTNLGGLAKSIEPNFVNLDHESALGVTSTEGFMVGFTCVEGDVIAATNGHRIYRDDVILFTDVGSYSIVFKPPFIRGDLAVYQWDGEELILSRREQTAQDILARDIL